MKALFIKQIWSHHLVNGIVICLTIEMKPTKEHKKDFPHFGYTFLYIAHLWNKVPISSD